MYKQKRMADQKKKELDLTMFSRELNRFMEDLKQDLIVQMQDLNEMKLEDLRRMEF